MHTEQDTALSCPRMLYIATRVPLEAFYQAGDMDLQSMVTIALSGADYHRLIRDLCDSDLPQEYKGLILTLLGSTPRSMVEDVCYWKQYAMLHIETKQQEWAFRQVVAQRIMMRGADPQGLIEELIKTIQICKSEGWDPEEFVAHLECVITWSKNFFYYNAGVQSCVDRAEKLLAELEIRHG